MGTDEIGGVSNPGFPVDDVHSHPCYLSNSHLRRRHSCLRLCVEMLHESETAGQTVTVKGGEPQTNTSHPAAESDEGSACLLDKQPNNVSVCLSLPLSLFLSPWKSKARQAPM